MTKSTSETLGIALCLAGVTLALSGCLYSRAQTQSPSTATEQLLLTRSVWQAVEALGTVARGVEFGVPPIPLGGIATPSIPFARVLKQRGYTALRSVARDADERILFRGEPVIGRASFEVYSLAFLVIRRNDIYPGEELSVGVD